MHRLLPFGGDVALDEIQHVSCAAACGGHQGRIGGERAIRFSYSSQLTVEGLDSVGRLHHAADQRAVVVHQGEVVPIVAPGGGDRGIMFAPLLVQIIESVLGLLARRCCVHELKVIHG